jgi:hypothetical protein
MLKDYANVWPVLDLLKSYLKYTSQANRRSNQSAARLVSVSNFQTQNTGLLMTFTGICRPQLGHHQGNNVFFSR